PAARAAITVMARQRRDRTVGGFRTKSGNGTRAGVTRVTEVRRFLSPGAPDGTCRVSPIRVVVGVDPSPHRRSGAGHRASARRPYGEPLRPEGGPAAQTGVVLPTSPHALDEPRPMPSPSVEAPPQQQQDGVSLSHGLKQRHLSMIALGGVIGAGLFVGSGAGIAAAGPSIVVAYALSGLLVMLVMRMLGEMSAAYPSSGSFSSHAERAIGPWAGFTAGWAFWVLLCTAVGLEGIGPAPI